MILHSPRAKHEESRRTTYTHTLTDPRLESGDRTVHDDGRPDTVWDPIQAHTAPMDPGKDSFNNIVAVINGGLPTLHGRPVTIAPGPEWFHPEPPADRKQV